MAASVDVSLRRRDRVRPTKSGWRSPVRANQMRSHLERVKGVASLKEVCKEFISEGDKQDSPGYHPGWSHVL